MVDIKLVFLNVVVSFQLCALATAFLLYVVRPENFTKDRLQKRYNRAVGIAIIVFLLSSAGALAGIAALVIQAIS